MPDAQARLTVALADRYRLERELGQGGMATVYLAQDLKHDRKVAIKVLRPELAAVIGADRFLSEIKTTANLQHPHILPLFDSGQTAGRSDGQEGSYLFYVMPFIEGESLRDRLNREKQLPIADAVRIATEVASALDYAHRHNVIHRDIKPENILLHDGRALVADFGIALAASKAGGSRMTETGMSLGTPTYMSPEQAMGEREITARSDVYALGCVLYEMLTGDPPFTGSTAQAIVARVVTEHPRSLTSQRHTIPPHVEAAVLTSLEKLPADRFATAAEFAAALADRNFATTATVASTAPSADGQRWRRLAGALAIAFVLLAVVAALGWMRRTPAGLVRRFTISMSNGGFGNAVISPDGSRFVYSNSEGALLMRSGDNLTSTPIPGTEAAWAPVFSPDGKSLAFNTGFPGAVKIVPLDGGAVRTLVAGSTHGSGLAWSDDGWIYFLQGQDYGRDLMRIRAGGGTAEFVARPDSAANALFFYWPQVLPGGRKLLLTVYPISGEPSIGVLDVASGQVTIIASGMAARFSPTGHILVAQEDGSLRAARFDPAGGTVEGGFTIVAEGLNATSAGETPFSLASDGTLIYQMATAAGHVVRVTRDGGREEVVDPDWRGEFGPLALSPDGSLLAISAARSGRMEMWVRALGAGTLTRLSAGGTLNYRPSWSPDGRNVMFTSDQQGRITTYLVPADGSAPATRLLDVGSSVDEAAYSHDGKWVVYRSGSGGGRNIYARQIGGDSSVRTIAAGPAEEFSPALSPDGRWLAYASDETGRTEVYVRPFPNAGTARHLVSRRGGSEPVWSHSGKELFFCNGEEDLVTVEIAPGDAFRASAERMLFSTRGYKHDKRHNHYTLSPDDRFFYFATSPSVGGPGEQLVITLNWFEELKRKVGK